MILKPTQIKALYKIAIHAAEEAGTHILQASKTPITTIHKNAGSTQASNLLTQTDLESQSIILKNLFPTLDQYDLGLLSEERQDNGLRHEKDYFWCVDPLDGTLPFTERKPGFSVSIALISRDGTPIIGVIHDPSRNNTYSAYLNHGVRLNNKPWALVARPNQYFTLVCDRSFETDPYNSQIETLIKKSKQPIKTLNYGGAALNAIWTLENTPALYIKSPKEKQGGGSTWDFAAACCIFNESKKTACDAFGNTLQLNDKDTTFMNKKGVIFHSHSSKEKAALLLEDIFSMYKTLNVNKL